MQIQACIANLLYQHQSVNLPGLGTILAQYRDASIDHVQGAITPPAKTLTFDSNLVMDDGLLAAEVASEYKLGYAEASTQVGLFVEMLQDAIRRGEVAEIQGVGRLFRDFEGKVQFLPEDYNFNPGSYGLPDLQCHPVIRRPASEQPAQATPPSVQSGFQPVRDTWWQRNVLWMALLAIILLSASIVWIQFFSSPNTETPALAEVPEEFLNVSPSEAEEVAPSPSEEPIVEEETDTEAPTVLPNQKICTIRIGKFGNVDNVRRLVRKAQELGMNPYTKKEGGLTEVGITFPYSEQKEIQQMLADARKYLSPDAIVEKK